MIHNHEVGGSDPPLATDNQIVSNIEIIKNPSQFFDGEGFFIYNLLVINSIKFLTV
jgi:hypothetical protein